MATESDTPSQEPGTFETADDAAAAFRAMLDASEAEPEKEPKVDTEVDPPADPVDPEPADESTDDAPITLEVDGKQVTLTKAELAEAYKSGLRQSDYTAKTTAVAEQRKAAEAETQKAQQERATYAQNLQKMAAQLEGALEEQGKIDWDALIAQDPHEALKQQHLLQKRQAALQQNFAQQNAIARQAQAEQAEAMKALIATQQEQLLAKLPDWKDEAKASSERDAIKAYLIKEGYDEKDALNITDHRAVLMSRKAMLYDQMMAKANAAQKKIANLPTKVERPGVGSDRSAPDGRSTAMKQFMKSGSAEDMAAAWKTFL